MTKIKKITIFGERCSGTNYLERLLYINFYDFKLTWEYGYKHFFGHKSLANSDDTLFICIVRNPVDWINSLYRTPWHIAQELRGNVDNFLNKEFYSYNDESSGSRDGTEIMTDRNIYTGKRYKNIFELRHIKLKYLYKDLPKLVKHYIFIKHEDLIEQFTETMLKLKDKGLTSKPTIQFPLNYHSDVSPRVARLNVPYKKKTNAIDESLIINHPSLNKRYETKIAYV